MLFEQVIHRLSQSWLG